MFQRLRNILKSRKRKKEKAQIAVILILFFAILLVGLGVVINLSKVSQIKTGVTIAADTTSAFMGSMMASYAEAYYQEGIKRGTQAGHSGLSKNVTDWGLMGKILAVIIAIIALLIVIFSSGLGTPLAIALCAFAVAISITALVLQITVVQPAITNMWATMFSNLPYADQFQETAINTALQKASNDSVKIKDTADLDQDGYYYNDGTSEGDAEKVGRFSFLYTQRANEIAGSVALQAGVAEEFLKAVAEFTYDEPTQADGSPWFSWDPAWSLPPDGWGVLDAQAKNCPSSGYFRNECVLDCKPYANTGNPCPNNGTIWNLIYDENYEDPNNSFESFREFFGRDDENPAISFSPNPYGIATATSTAPKKYLEKDSRGIYNLLWRMNQVSLDYPASDDRHCFWCATEELGCASTGGFDLSDFNTSLINCTESSQGCCISPDLDQITGSVLESDIVDPGACYIQAEDFAWKKGINNYCGTLLPYSECPTKSCASNCTFSYTPGSLTCCSDPALAEGCFPSPEACVPDYGCGIDGNGNPFSNKELWGEDFIDTLRYNNESGIDAFLLWAKEILERSPSMLMASTDWYSEFRYWAGNPETGEVGMLMQWANIINAIRLEFGQYLGNFPGQDMICRPGVPSTWYEIEACYDDILTDIIKCYTACETNESLCDSLATRLGLNFEEPPINNDEATGCDISNDPPNSVGTETYSFKRELLMWKEKIEHRRDFLFGSDGNGGVYGEIGDVSAKLMEANTKINVFLGDPRLVMMNTMANSSQSFYGDHSTATYAWKDQPEDGSEGKWHIVRVEARLPTRCDDKCGRTSCEDNSYCSEPDLPWIKEWKHSIGTNRWYSLLDYGCRGDCGQGHSPGKKKWKCGKGYKNKESFKDIEKCFKGGLTKARVVRYDEGGGILKWATNKEFWKMLFTNPSAIPLVGAGPGYIENSAYCGNILAAGGGSIDGGGSFGIDGAILLSRPSPENYDCWVLLNKLLKVGTEVQSCTEYYCTKNENSMFAVKFVTCPAGVFD